MVCINKSEKQQTIEERIIAFEIFSNICSKYAQNKSQQTYTEIFNLLAFNAEIFCRWIENEVPIPDNFINKLKTYYSEETMEVIIGICIVLGMLEVNITPLIYHQLADITIS